MQPPCPDDEWTVPNFMRSALLMIDTQRDFLNGGASPVPGTSVLLPAMGRLVEGYRFAGLPIVHAIRLYAGDDVDLPRRTALRDGARIVRPGSSGADIASALLPSPGVSLESDRLRSEEHTSELQSRFELVCRR